MSESKKQVSQEETTRSSTSRRDFIKRGSSLIVAGGVAGTMVGGQLSMARAAHPGGLDTMRIGLIGCGGRGTGAAIQAMNTEGPTQLVAMGDLFPDRMQGAYRAIKGQHGEKVDVPQDRQFVGFDAYKRVLESDIDIVILATPPGFRPLHFETAVNAKKHVFMEKPVAVDAPGVRRVLAANEIAKQNGTAVAVGLQRRHETHYQQCISELQDGAIGHINFMRAYWNGGGVWVRPRKEMQTELEYQCTNWYYFNWLCGDHIDEQHIHNLDVINWFKNGYPVAAQGQGGRQVRTGKEYGQIFDHHAVEFTYEDGSTMLSQCRHIQKCWNSVSEHFHSSQGTADFLGKKAIIRDLEGNTIWELEGESNGHQQEHHDLFADLRNGIIPNEGEYGAKSTMTAIFGRMATYSGKRLSWNEAINSDLVLCDVDKLAGMGREGLEMEAPVQPDENGFYPVPMPGEKIDQVL